MGKGRHVFTIDDNAEMAEANAWMAMRAHVCVCTIDNIIDNIEAIGGMTVGVRNQVVRRHV